MLLKEKYMNASATEIHGPSAEATTVKVASVKL